MDLIKNNVYYVGIKDADRELFDMLVPLPEGTSYNSFYIKGSEKSALIDTTYPKKINQYVENLLANNINPDYIIANHGEQDHSGALPTLIEKFPTAQIVTNTKCKELIIEMLHIPENKFIIVNDNDELSLGDKTLQFILAPMVHWPDTMFTYLKEDKMLFTCDFLGAHYTSGNLISKGSKELEIASKRYYAEIMMPFRPFCSKYTKKIKDMDVDIILPSHGAIYTNPNFILDLYEKWSSNDTVNKVVIPYVSMYESTKMMVDTLSDKLVKNGIEVVKFDLSNYDEGELAMEVVDATTVVIGASMVLAGPHPLAVYATYLINTIRPKIKNFAILGSFGWGGNLEGSLENLLTIIKPEKLGNIVVKGRPNEEDLSKVLSLADLIIEKHSNL